MNDQQNFWNWFKENEAKYFFLNQIEDNEEKEMLLNEFLDRLHCYCDSLFFEIGGTPNEKQDLIITAGGDPDYFDTVETLVQQAPPLEHWNVIALKPFMEGNIIEYNDAKLDPEKIYFIPLNSKSTNKIGLRIYVDNYNSANEKDFLFAAYILLDGILGEKSSALDIGYVEIEDLSKDIDREELIELIKLRRYIEWKKSKAKS